MSEYSLSLSNDTAHYFTKYEGKKSY